MGKRREAVQALRTIEKNSALDGKEHMLALIYSALGDRDRAIAELEKRGTDAFLDAICVRGPAT